MPILNSINQMQNEMQKWRRDLHKIPEIGLKEYKTSEYIKNKLNDWGIDFKDGYANTGIIATIKGSAGNSDKSIGMCSICIGGGEANSMIVERLK